MNKNSQEKILKNAIDASAAYWFITTRGSIKNLIPTSIKNLESILSKDFVFSYRYACFLKKRFKKGENKISENLEYSYYYAENIIKNKLPEKMHMKMIAQAVKEPENKWIKKYFELIKKVDKKNLSHTISKRQREKNEKRI